MANLQEKISRLFPEATFEEGEILLVNIPDARLHDLVKTLRDDKDMNFDYLVTIVGMDWVSSLGCVYYLTSTVSKEFISVKTSTTDRDNPMLHSIADLYRIAVFYEREVFDFFGIKFINNPDMRRLFLNIDWVGYPFRKDYDANPEINPVSIENERQTDPWYSTRTISSLISDLSTRPHTAFCVSARLSTERLSRKSTSTWDISIAEWKNSVRT